MDQVKVGKFIAECRKNKNMTQAELAEKLNITDRAISKWETGKGMPDSSIMLELCNELDISVNELLSGEMIEMKNYNERAEELLIKMTKKEEIINKKLLVSMYIIIVITIIADVSIVALAQYFIIDTILSDIVCLISTICCILIMLYCLKLEKDIGYYECKNCHYKFIPTYKEVLLTTHIGTTRYLKCPKCNEKSWNKKVLTK